MDPIVPGTDIGQSIDMSGRIPPRLRHRMRRVSPPAVLPVSLAEAKAHCRVYHNEDDVLISALVMAATQHVDGVDGWLGRALVSQQWEMVLDAFPRDYRIRLPLAPVLAVDGVLYRAPDGSELEMDSSRWYLADGGEGISWLALENQASWPSTEGRDGAVRVRFTAGYAPTTDSPPDLAGNVPEPIKAAIKLMVGDMYENREERIVGTIVAELPTVQRLLAPYRISWW